GVLAQGTAGPARSPQPSAVSAIMKQDNREQVERSYAAELSQATADLDSLIQKRDRELVQAGNEYLLTARTAAEDLDGYVRRVGELFRLGMGLAGLVCFAVACLFL